MTNLPITDIKVGRRHRQDMGDIDALADSIKEIGLLHPVVVTPKHTLIAGERRILAFKKLGREKIPATVIDLDRIVFGEYAENFFRKTFTPSEIVAITEAIEPVERAKAKERQGQRTDKHPGKLPGSSNGQALDKVANVVGKGRRTIEKARAVVEAAKVAPQQYAAIKHEMDRTGNVDRAHKKLQTTQKRAEFDATVAASLAAPVTDQLVINADCIEHMRQMAAGSVDVVVTSPPYNIGVEYRSHADDMPRAEYLGWLGKVFVEVRRVMKPKGSFFLNVGNTSKDPWLEADLASALRSLFSLQNHIIWVKAIAIDDQMIGHYKPVNSQRFLNQQYESIFHLTANGDIEIDRLAVGVPFSDKSNINRSGHAIDMHCAGDTWFIPYETAQSKSDKFQHPAGFPVGLVERCIKLHGLKPALTVLDPFLGSGTTLVASRQLGCSGIGIESDAHYAKVSIARLGAADAS